MINCERCQCQKAISHIILHWGGVRKNENKIEKIMGIFFVFREKICEKLFVFQQ